MLEIKNLSNAALSYVINCWLNTDCWFDEQVKDWRDKLDAGYRPGIRTDEHGKDYPCIEGEEHESLSFLWFVRDNFDGKKFTFNEISLLGIFCATFIGCGISSVTVNVMAYPDETGTVIDAVKEDGSHFQRFDFQITGAEEYNALEDFVTVLHNMYADWGNCVAWHIETTGFEVDEEDWFTKK